MKWTSQKLVILAVGPKLLLKNLSGTIHNYYCKFASIMWQFSCGEPWTLNNMERGYEEFKMN